MFRLFIINLIVLFVWVPRLRNFLLSLCGLRLHAKSKIGLCLILTKNIELGAKATISHFNYLQCNSIQLLKEANVGKVNYFKGAFDVCLGQKSQIGNTNIFKNNGLSVIPEMSALKLGSNSKITSAHYFDMTCDVQFGINSTLAGRSSSLWTHGFIHFDLGKVRPIKLSSIFIGDGVYIGSNCVLNPGTIVSNEVNIGSGCSLSGRLEAPGLYVNQGLRHIDIGSLEEFLSKRVYDSKYKTGNIRIY